MHTSKSVGWQSTFRDLKLKLAQGLESLGMLVEETIKCVHYTNITLLVKQTRTSPWRLGVRSSFLCTDRSYFGCLNWPCLKPYSIHAFLYLGTHLNAILVCDLFFCLSANYQNEYEIVFYSAQNCDALLKKLSEISWAIIR